jgi:hypothetical protein
MFSMVQIMIPVTRIMIPIVQIMIQADWIIIPITWIMIPMSRIMIPIAGNPSAMPDSRFFIFISRLRGTGIMVIVKTARLNV